MTAEEEWRPVVGHPRYEVSSLGRVRSLFRSEPRILRGGLDRYRQVWMDGRTYRVHQLVARAFLGPQPPGHDVRHLDCDRENNALSNLAYGTKAQNMADSVAHGIAGQAAKTHCKRGHAFDETNTHWYRNPRSGRQQRICRSCTRRGQVAA